MIEMDEMKQFSQQKEEDFFHYAIVCLFGLQCGWCNRSQVDCSLRWWSVI